jgi:HEAT repeat protein
MTGTDLSNCPRSPRQPKLPRLGQAGTRIGRHLEHPNGWHRDTAARLLYERQDKSALPDLGKILANSKSPLGRLHALYALDGLSSLKEWHILKGLNDPDPRVREHAVLLSEKLLSKIGLSSLIWKQYKALSGDPNPRVRYQLSFTLGEIQHREKATLLASLARREMENRWTKMAILSSVNEEAIDLLDELLVLGRRQAQNS